MTIADSIKKHQELLAQGKATPVPNPPNLDAPSMPPPVGTGIPGPNRGSYTPDQILHTDFQKANTIGGPVRSPMFPIPQNTTNNTAAAKAALQAAAKASETATAAVAAISNANIVTVSSTSGALQSGTLAPPHGPLPVPPRNINQDQMSLDGVVHGRVLQSALTADSVDPSKSGVLSKGVRPFSVAPQMAFVPGANSVTFYYDGTNNSLPLHLFRDDGTITDLTGSQAITGLTASTPYYFYPEYDEVLNAIGWSTDFTPNAFVGADFSQNNSSPFGGYITTTTSFSASTLAFSVEFWFQSTASSLSPLWQLNTAQTGSAGTVVARVILSSGKIAGQIFTGSVTNSVVGSISVNDGQIHHVVFTYGTGVGTIYVDGVQDAVNFSMGTIDPVTVWNWIYGEFTVNPGVASFWMSRCAFYKGAALNSSQVANHFNCAVNLNIAAYDALVAMDGASYFWKLTEASGTTAADSIGTNTGTYTNVSYFTYAVSENTINFVGSPAIAQTRSSYRALQRQNLAFRIALSNGGTKVTTGGSSGGGGITPGGGGGGKFTQFF